MNGNIEALLDLQVIDQKRQTLRKRRAAKTQAANAARKDAQTKREAIDAIQTELDRLDALIRQYQADSQRCETTITALRAKQMEAKTNKEYMGIINGIEQARVEKTHRDTSLLELTSKREILATKGQDARTAADAAQAALEAAEAAAQAAQTPGPQEAELESKYLARKGDVEPAFLEAYERLVNAGHRQPLIRVDPKTRATPWGAVLSINQVEHLRTGHLVLAPSTNQILFVE